MSSQENYTISFDIETTGQFMTKDTMFAVGFCDSNMNKKSIALDLGKPNNMSWKDFWKQQGWEQRCYDEFWSKNLDTLNKLQNPDHIKLVKTESELIKYIHEETLKFEQNSKNKVEYITDAIGFDFSWLSFMFSKYNHPSMTYNRSGKYCRRFEIDSYIMGLKGTTSDDYRNVQIFKRELEKKYGSHLNRLHPHDPADDAEYIMRCYTFAKKFVFDNKNKDSNKRRKKNF